MLEELLLELRIVGCDLKLSCGDNRQLYKVDVALRKTCSIRPIRSTSTFVLNESFSSKVELLHVFNMMVHELSVPRTEP